MTSVLFIVVKLELLPDPWNSSFVPYDRFQPLVGLGFGGLPRPALLAEAPAAAAEAALEGDEEGEQHDGRQEGDDVQRVVLYPVEVVGSGAQVRGSLVPHHKLHPVHSQVQRVDGSVQVQVGEALDVLLVPAERRRLWGVFKHGIGALGF